MNPKDNLSRKLNSCEIKDIKHWKKFTSNQKICLET